MPIKHAMRAFERFPRGVYRTVGARSRFVQTSVGRMHVYQARGFGALPPVVLIHGIGASATAVSRVFLRLLRHHRRLSAVELPGHGDSEAPVGGMNADQFHLALTETLDRIIGEPAVLFGSSLGGFSAIRYTVARQHKVARLVLSSPGGASMDEEELKNLLSTFRIKDTEDAKLFLDRLCLRRPWYTPLLARFIVHQFGRPELTSALDLASPDVLLSKEELSVLRVPTLVLWGQADTLLPRESLSFFKTHMPAHVRFVEPHDFSHIPHLERPKKVARYILDFTSQAL